MNKVLEALYGDDVARVQVAFESEDPKTLIDLADDETLAVRLEIAGNENTPPQALKKLSYDENASVRLQVAGNFNADAETIAKLLGDKNPAVAEEASYSDHA
jgi:hypothetical protein